METISLRLMRRRLSERKAGTLRLGRDRLGLRPWGGEAGAGLIVLLDSGAVVADATTTRVIETATAAGYRRLVTSALSGIESEPFLRAGFRPCQRLALLARPIQSRLPTRRTETVIRRARRRDHSSVLAVDHAAFDPFWRTDHAGLRDALRATPYRRFRVVRPGPHSGVNGYAICGRSGPIGYLQRLAVAPDQQGQGTGEALVIDGLRWMGRWGVSQAWVNTPHHNSGALRLYERLGFELVPPGLQVLELNLAP